MVGAARANREADLDRAELKAFELDAWVQIYLLD